MTLSVTRIARISRLLDEVLPLDESARLCWLEHLASERCSLEPALRKLLAGTDTASGLVGLETVPKIKAHPGGPCVAASALKPGEWVGDYQLVRLLGVGGMAEVWLATHADGALGREVALKLPLLSRLRPDLAPRFARERDILARLEHAHIPRVLDAGVSHDGLPYIAMEPVVGEPLNDWCDSHRLGLQDRIRLFLQVLDAVHHAHAHGVIHRDLKPSNILVTEAGSVQLLDFGVAKLLTAQGEEAEITRVYGRALTVDYASPELVRGEPSDCTSDVYSLGVLLYELLTGSRPYRVRTSASCSQIEHAISTVQVVRPSAQSTPQAATVRATSQRELARVLRGNLDAIVLKAMSRDPARRYASVASLAADLKRHLGGAPVEARPDGLASRVGGFFRRHGTAIAIAAALLGFVASIGLVPDRAPTFIAPDTGIRVAVG